MTQIYCKNSTYNLPCSLYSLWLCFWYLFGESWSRYIKYYLSLITFSGLLHLCKPFLFLKYLCISEEFTNSKDCNCTEPCVKLVLFHFNTMCKVQTSDTWLNLHFFNQDKNKIPLKMYIHEHFLHNLLISELLNNKVPLNFLSSKNHAKFDINVQF